MLDEIAPEETDTRTRAGELVLVDVREADERRELAPAVPSLHIPIDQITERIGELPVDQPIAFVCRSGGRSAVATEIARSIGLDARNVVGGMLAWDALGLPTVAESA